MAQEQRARELGRLREETQGLQERLRLLEEGGGQVDDLTVKVQENLAQPSTSDELEGENCSRAYALENTVLFLVLSLLNSPLKVGHRRENRG